MKKILSLQIVLSVLFVFATKSYSADYDYGVFSACVNGCRGNNAAYSKLSKTEKENANRLIKTCVQACMDATKGTKSVETKESDTSQQEDNEKSQEQSEFPRLVLNLGVGVAYPADYAYPTGLIITSATN